MLRLRFISFIILLTWSTVANGQENFPNVTFSAADNQKLGFNDVPESIWKVKYPWVANREGVRSYVPVKILAKRKTDYILATLSDTVHFSWSDIAFFYGSKTLVPIVKSRSKALLKIVNPQKALEIGAYFKDRPVGQLRTRLLERRNRKVILVPLVQTELQRKEIEDALNSIYAPANNHWNVILEKPFAHHLFSATTVFGSPNEELRQYTGQMRLLRDKYFEQNKKIDRNAYYIFIIPSFADYSASGYMLPFKSMGFVPFQKDPKRLSIQLARTLAVGVGGVEYSWENGPEKGSTTNLMDTTFGTDFQFFQLQQLQFSDFYFTTRDAYEQVRTGNGTVGYYFWEQDEKGNIVFRKKPIRSIKRPFKKNFLAYRFDVQFAILKPLFRWGPYYISIVNFVFVLLILTLLFFLRKKVKNFWERKNWKHFLRRPLFWVKLIGAFYLIYLSFGWGNQVLDRFKLLAGPLPELTGFSYTRAKSDLFSNVNFRKESEYNLSSEVLIHEKKKWFFKKLKPVLYFEVSTGSKKKDVLRFTTSSDFLTVRTENYSAKADNHYCIVTYKNRAGEIEKQEVFNYAGERLENWRKREDFPKRVLVFVNGYRPTSSGKNFGEAFNDVLAQGLEFPNSTNFIYNFDRYDYWQPWGEINLQFQNKINPSATFYADGHFSVSTSDYGSLLNFSRTSQIYPKRCINLKKHTCHKVKNDHFFKFILPNKKTENLIDHYPNTQGFRYRKEKGKIAGMNLLQELNLYPGLSKNDTLYLVAHSMGYAYSLGMIEQLRGKIQLGGFYILAPENAKSGQVNPKEWREIWQYGSDFQLKNADAPCLQDGVAPQSGAKGLPYNKRVFIPKKQNNRKGFFDSHFVGYYDWILKLKPSEKGYIQQR